MGKVRILVVEVVYALCEGKNACVRIGGLESGKLDAAEEELLNVHSVVLGHFFGDDLTYSLTYGCVVKVGVVLSEGVLVLVRLLLSLLVVLFVEDNVFDDSHNCWFFIVCW